MSNAVFSRTFTAPITPEQLPDVLLDIAGVAPELLAGPKKWGNKPIGGVQVVVSVPETDEPKSTIADMRRLGRETLGFGKHANEPLNDIPIDYLEWLHDTTAATLRKLRAYLDHPEVKREREHASDGE